MATLKEAVENAIAFAQQNLGASRTRDIRLDEIEFDNIKGADSWLITLSMEQEERNKLSLGLEGWTGQRNREYKVFTVNKESGEVIAMKIREVANQ